MMQEDILHLSIFFWNICGFYFFFCVFGREKFVVRSTIIADLLLSYDLTMQEDILDLLMVIFFAYMLFILSDFFAFV